MLSKQKVLIIGSSGHAKAIIDIFEHNERYYIIGLIDDFRNKGEETLGYKVLGKIEDISLIIKDYSDFKIFVAIGDNWARQLVVNKILSIVPFIEFAAAVHPSAVIGRDVKIGKGVAIMPAAVINSGSVVGDFSIINTKASLSHDVKMLKYSALAPNATIGGNVTIGEFSAICIGATIVNKLKIGNHSVIGAGSLLTNNCPDNVIMYGVPAKIIRNREIGEKYIK